MRKQSVYLLVSSAVICAGGRVARAQELQLHYDWRHAVDPRDNPSNFPSLGFKIYKGLDFGSFLLKMEGDLNGTRNNLSKVYVEVSQGLRFWKPSFYLHVEYTGGLGLFDGGNGGYYLENAYLLGAAHPFPWQGSWGSVFVAYKYTNFRHPSHDPELSLYWGKVFQGRWAFASTTVAWTQDRNHGDAMTANVSGKRFAALIENELWYNALSHLSCGSLIRVSYNVYATDGRLLLYPTVGIRYFF